MNERVSVDAVFAALGDPVRSTIVDRLTDSDATIGELAAGFDITVQAVSRHVGVLVRAGVVARAQEGRHRRVRLRPERLAEAVDWMEQRRRRLEQRYTRLDAVLDDLKRTTEEEP